MIRILILKCRKKPIY